jgi:hypothetical protein
MGTGRHTLALVRATSSDQVAATVRICARFGCRSLRAVLARACPVAPMPSTAASSRSTGSTIRLIDPLERLAVVQAGVINDELRAAAAEQGLWYPPDPHSPGRPLAATSRPTPAVCCVKYGGDYVLAEVVTGTGELVRLGRKRQGGRWVRSGRPDGWLGGHSRHHHRGHRTACLCQPHARLSATSVRSSTPASGASSRQTGITPSALGWSTGTAWLLSTSGRTGLGRGGRLCWADR